MSKSIFHITLLTFVLGTAIFLLFPTIDLRFSRHLWSPEQGFWGWRYAGLEWLHENLRVFVLVGFLTLLIGWLLCRFNRAPVLFARYRKSFFFLMLVIIVGPGLVVNALFKDQWGRPRPHQVEDFGGSRTFTPAWVISDQCERNCSFVCGDASIGFVLIAGVFISRRPRLWFLSSLLAGGLLGLMRIAQGGHFLSDVIFCWYMVACTTWLLARMLKVGIYAPHNSGTTLPQIPSQTRELTQ